MCRAYCCRPSRLCAIARASDDDVIGWKKSLNKRSGLAIFGGYLQPYCLSLGRKPRLRQYGGSHQKSRKIKKNSKQKNDMAMI